MTPRSERWLHTFLKTAARNHTMDVLFGGSRSVLGIVLGSSLSWAIGPAAVSVPIVSAATWFGKTLFEIYLERRHLDPVGTAYDIVKSQSGVLRLEVRKPAILGQLPLALPETCELPVEDLWSPLPPDSRSILESLDTASPREIYHLLGLSADLPQIFAPSPRSRPPEARLCATCGQLLPNHAWWCTATEPVRMGTTDGLTCPECGQSVFAHAPRCSRQRPTALPAVFPITPRPQPVPHAQIEDLWVQYNVREGREKGMRIHTRFTAHQLKGVRCRLTVYFYHADGTILRDFNHYYRTDEGQVAVSEDFTPSYDTTAFDDFAVFMPFRELHLGNGRHDLKFCVQIYPVGGGLLYENSDYECFSMDCRSFSSGVE